MKAVIIKEYGNANKLLYTDVEKPRVGEGEALIHIKAAGVNPVDCKIREGYLKERMPNVLPIIPGWDMAGIIVETGYSARRFKEGDEVYAYARRPILHHGTYTEYIALPESYISYKPTVLSFEEAAGIPLAGLTAFQALFDKAGLTKGQSLLIIGASGGVGSFAVQLGKIAGAKVYAIASAKNEKYLFALGADFFIDYTKGDFRNTLKTMQPSGVDVVFDCAGKEATLKAYECVKEGGTLVSILSQINPVLAEMHKVNFRYLFVEANARQLDQIREWTEAGMIKVHIQNIYELKDAVKAHEQIETTHTQGKIVLRIP